MVFSGLFLTQLSPTQIIVGVFLMSASIWCGIKVSSSREILHPDLLIDLITGKFKVEGNFIFYKFCCTSLLKSHLLFFFRVRQVLCIQHLHCWSFFPQELMCHLSISASLTNSSSQLILVCFYGIVLIFTFVLRCCSVSWVYRSCCSTTGTSAFQVQDFLFFLGYNCQSGLEISEMQSSVSLYSTYMVTSALWKWYKTLFPTLKKKNQKTPFFLSYSAKGIKNQYGKHGDEVFCGSYFLWRTSLMHTHLGGFFLQELWLLFNNVCEWMVVEVRNQLMAVWSTRKAKGEKKCTPIL